MANVLSNHPFGRRSGATWDARELSRKLDLIEDRPDAVLTWSDVARHARALWRRLDAASPRNR
jgi:hypothetical protein